MNWNRIPATRKGQNSKADTMKQPDDNRAVAFSSRAPCWVWPSHSARGRPAGHCRFAIQNYSKGRHHDPK
jgi:hypothetical protein